MIRPYLWVGGLLRTIRKHVVGCNIYNWGEKPDHQKNADDKSKHNCQLGSRCALNRLARIYIAYFPCAVLRLFSIHEPVNFTRQANAKHGFKKQKYEAKKTDYAGKRAVGIGNDEQSKH